MSEFVPKSLDELDSAFAGDKTGEPRVPAASEGESVPQIPPVPLAAFAPAQEAAPKTPPKPRESLIPQPVFYKPAPMQSPVVPRESAAANGSVLPKAQKVFKPEQPLRAENPRNSEAGARAKKVNNADMQINLFPVNDDAKKEATKKKIRQLRSKHREELTEKNMAARKIGIVLLAVALFVTVLLTCVSAFFAAALNHTERTVFGCYLCTADRSVSTPVIESGSLVFVLPRKAGDLKRGLLVAYRDSNAHMNRYACIMDYHTDSEHQGVVFDVTYADKNGRQFNDTVTEDVLLGTVAYTMPRVGSVLSFFQSYAKPVLALVAGWALILILILVFLIRL